MGQNEIQGFASPLRSEFTFIEAVRQLSVSNYASFSSLFSTTESHILYMIDVILTFPEKSQKNSDINVAQYNKI